MEALIVIDVQKGCLKIPRFEIKTKIEKMNMLLDTFHEKGLPVFFIQHNGIKENYLLPGTEDFDLEESLHVMETDIRIEKKVNNAFYETTLKEQLDSLKINTLYIAGLATEFCVNATVLDALNYDYTIIVAGDGHTTADRELLSADKIINFYNWLWPNLTPTKGKIEVKNTSEIVKSVE
jgi:nicotinamidase-related amidase